MRFLSLALAFFLSGCVTAPAPQPLPEDGLFARVMPQVFADAFAAGSGRLASGSEVFVTAAKDLDGVLTPAEAQRRLALFSDYAGTQPNVTGDAIVKFRLRDPRLVRLHAPSKNITDPQTGRRIPRGYGFKYGGRTGGGAREWVMRNGTATELGAFDITVTSLRR
jgi:hypothetical protein